MTKMISKWINGTSDIMFKTIFKNPKNKDYVSLIISEVTKIPKEVIYKSLKFIPVEFNKENKREKQKIADLVIELDLELINIEMNKYVTKTTHIKNMKYIEKLDILQDEIANSYDNKKKIIQINFDMKRYPGNKIIYKWQLMENDLKIKYDDNKEIYTIDLVKIKQKCYNFINGIGKLSTFEKAIGILVVDDINDAIILSKDNTMLKKVVEQMGLFNLDDKMISIYYDPEKENQKIMNSLKQEFMEMGLEEGREKGLKQGIKEGIKEGSKKSSIQIAKNMLNKNMEISVISELTELSISEVETLKKELNL